MTDEELRQRLEEWGAAATPEPDAAFARRLERDLRSQAYFGQQPSREGRRTTALLRPALVMAAVLALALGAWLLSRSDGTSLVEVAVAEASDTRVVLPDGTTEDATPGAVLPEGTRVIVGPDGSAVVGGVVLSANTTATVADGSVVIDSIPLDDPTPSATGRPVATPTVAERPPAALPTPTPLSDQRPVDRPPATATAAPEPTETVARGPQTELRVLRPSASRALLDWTVSGETAGIDGWEVLVRRGDEIRTLATLRDPSARELSVAVPDAPPDGFRIVARGSGGAVISRSEFVPLPEPDRSR